MQRNAHPSCFWISTSMGTFDEGLHSFTYILLPQIHPDVCARVCTHTRAHAHRHIHPAACNPLLCPYPVDLSSLKNYRQRIYSFGRIPGTTFTYSSNEMGSRLFKPCCLQIKHKGGTSLSGDMAPSFPSCLLFLSNFKLVWKVS